MSVSNKYIDINKILGYKRVFNVLLSDRNAGKTYGVIKLLYKNFIDNGHKFIVLKRTVEDVKRTVGWGKKVAYYEYPTHDIKQNKNKIIIDGKEAGVFIPLSTSITLKDNDFFGYKYIFYDDCIIPFGSTKKYLKDEGLLLSELYITVDRNEDKTIMILCGNTISNTNPIFEFFNIKVSDKEYTFGKDYVVYKAKANTERLTTLENTRFGNLIKTNDTQYQSYLTNKNYDMILCSMNLSVSPDLSTFFGTNNLANYSNEEVTNIMNEVKNSNDENKLKQDYKRLGEIYKSEMPYLSLYNNKYTVAYSTGLAGTLEPNWFYQFYNIKDWHK